jgi:hypothetical protein
MRRTAFLLASVLCVPAAAQEDSDLGRIPSAVGEQQAPPASTAAAHGKYFVENDLGLASYRGTFAVPLFFAPESRWANRTSVDALDRWSLTPDLTLDYADRLSVTTSDGVVFPRDSVRNELKELYLVWEPVPQTYVQFGRINVREGSYGYSPVDFFSARTTVAQASSSPAAARENRLGTVMLRVQRVFDGGTVSVIYAPKLHDPAPLGAVPDWIDPKIDQTNGSDRMLASLSLEVEDFSPEVFLYNGSGRTKYGLSLSHPIGNSIIGYAAWTGGRAPSLATDAFRFAQLTGTIPSFVPMPPALDSSRTFRSALSVGSSWTASEKVNVVLEYEYNGAGLSKQDWRNWFAFGADPSNASAAWYVRGYAGDQQQPISQHQMFAYASWYEPFNLEKFGLSAYVMTSLEDGSSMGQLSASWDISDRWSAGIYLGGLTGGRHSEWGSLASAGSATFQVVRYL